jgi:lipoyl(octanoyl) transferase
MNAPLVFERIPGLSDYTFAHARQLALREAIARGIMPDTVLLLEHTPVITLGRKADPSHVTAVPEELSEMGIDRLAVDRGGDVTYHGPGQMVAYPILDLNHWKPSVGWYLRTLEQVVIDLVADYGLSGERLEGFTGVWVGGGKIAAIGVGVHQWVTFHGVALNVAPDMRHWACIVPCGIADRPVVSLADLLGTAPPMAEVMDRFEGHFRRVFG